MEDRDSALVADLIDDSGKPLLRFGLPYGRPCADGAEVADRLVIAKLPFPTATRTIRFVLDGVLIHELVVPREAPVVHLTWDPSQGTDAEQRVSWWGEHREGRELRYLVSYSHDDGRSWQPLSLPVPETEHAVDFGRLAGGSHCRIRVLASDGVNTTAAISDAFQRPIQPCYAMILAPDHDAVFAPDEPVRLQGQVFYLEEREPELELLDWTSSREGRLGRGAIIEVRRLSPGSHEITLAAGREGRIGTTSTTLRVG